jgi:hypothetical protein
MWYPHVSHKTQASLAIAYGKMCQVVWVIGRGRSLRPFSREFIFISSFNYYWRLITQNMWYPPVGHKTQAILLKGKYVSICVVDVCLHIWCSYFVIIIMIMFVISMSLGKYWWLIRYHFFKQTSMHNSYFVKITSVGNELIWHSILYELAPS